MVIKILAKLEFKDFTSQYIKSILFRMDKYPGYVNKSFRDFLLDRIKLFTKIFYFIICIFRDKCEIPKEPSIIFTSNSSNLDVSNFLKDIIARNTGERAICFGDLKECLVFRRTIEFLSIYAGSLMKLVLYLILGMISTYKYKISWIANSYANLLRFYQFCHYIKRIYVFSFQTPEFYLTAALISNKCRNSNVFLVKGEGPLAIYCKYTYLPNVIFLATSDYQISEVKLLKNSGKFLVKNVDFFYLRKHQCKTFPRIDIGLYSSGEWAREDGLTRSNDIEKIKKYYFLENSRYRIFQDVLKELIEFAKSCGKTLIIYAHPLERFLYSEYKIIPPYLKLFKGHERISIDLLGKDSESKICEAKIGVTVFSTIAFERLNLSMPTFIYLDNRLLYEDDIPDKFRIYFYKNTEELITKIKNFFEYD